MNKNLFFIALILISTAGCVKFGDNIELSGKDVDGAILAKVTQLTGVEFPEGTIGKEYFYLGDSIDPSLRIKVAIPKEKKNEFLRNKIFVESKRGQVTYGEELDWWKPQALNDPVHVISHSTKGDVIECYVGEEAGEVIVYLSWVTI